MRASLPAWALAVSVLVVSLPVVGCRSRLVEWGFVTEAPKTTEELDAESAVDVQRAIEEARRREEAAEGTDDAAIEGDAVPALWDPDEDEDEEQDEEQDGDEDDDDDPR